jgi:hypothetical protein
MLALAVEQFANCCLSDACCKKKLSQITLVEGPFHLQIKQGSALDARDPAKIFKAVPRTWIRGSGIQGISSAIPFPSTVDKKQFCKSTSRITLPPTNLEQTQIPARGITCFYPGSRSHLMEPVLSMLEGGEAKYWALKLSLCKESRHVSSIRSLLNKKTATPPVKLPIIRPYDCLRESKSVPSSQQVDRLGSPGPLHWSGIYLCRTHLESGISQQAGRTTEALGRWELVRAGPFSGFFACDDLELINTLEIEEA